MVAQTFNTRREAKAFLGTKRGLILELNAKRFEVRILG